MMNKELSRAFFCFIFLTISTLVVNAGQAYPRAEQQPNILFLFADDWGRFASSYRGLDPTGFSELITTPNVDRLATEGILFTNAFNPVPSCTPSRGAIVTGQYFWRNGRAVNLGGGEWPAEPSVWEAQPKFPRILEYLGYLVAYSGKVGVEWWKDQPIENRFIRDEHRYSKHGNTFMNFSETVSGQPDTKKARQAVLDEVRANFQDVLSARKPGQPFFYWFGTFTAHRAWVQGSGKALWGIDPDALRGKMPADWPDSHTVREDVTDYLGEVQAFDAMAGVLLDELEKAGLLDTTLVVATGDNGIPGFPRAKRNLYDKGVYAPLMIRWPGKSKGGRVVSDFVNLFDLAPTFIEAAGGVPPKSMDAASLMAVIESNKSGRVDKDRDYVILGRERHVFHRPMRALRNDRYLLVHNLRLEDSEVIPDGPIDATRYMNIDGGPTAQYIIDNIEKPEVRRLYELAFDRRPEFELYNVKTDPDQIENLAAKPKHKKTLEKLREQLRTTLTERKDPRFSGDFSRFDRSPYIETDR